MAPVLHSTVSAVHVTAALLALLTGTYILATPKGTRRHRWVGWAYVSSMAVLLLTAFRIYFLFGRFGIVHWGAVGSTGALLLGVGAVVGRAVVPDWLRWHYVGMGVSVTSLYATFAVESTYRLFPATYFWWSTLGPGLFVLLLGGWLLRRHYPAWAAAYSSLREAAPRLR